MTHTFRSAPARALGLLCLPLLAVPALAQTGVSEDRVSLPDGPGSFSGLGENSSVGNNNGQYEHSIPLDLPMGHPGAVPAMALRYNSGGGNGVLGMGWSFGWPTMERMTSRGLPRYDRTDRFAADGGNELVLIPGTDPPVYRARFEGGFVRYTWLNAGTGNEGYWKSETPDGTVSYYGADSTGAIVPTSREGFADGTFRYHVVETINVDGEKVRYAYTKSGSTALLSEVTWLFDGAGTARNRLTLAYEARPDALSDCKPGFCWLLQQRLRTLTVSVAGQQLHRYTLSYEDMAESGGATRLRRVEQTAPDGSAFPQVYALTYSRSLGGVCAEATCGRPFLKTMGSLGVNLTGGSATLVDINGDALPDVVETPATGNHRFFVSQLDADGNHTYRPATTSATGNSSIRLNTASVQLMDVNGDGFADLASTKTGNVLYNTGNGDWSTSSNLGSANLPDMDADAMDGQISIKFIDYDNDKRIDVVRSFTAGTSIWRNTGDDFVEDTAVEAIGAGFAEDKLQFSDMNGDNLLDAVVVIQGGLRYRLSTGYGRWEPWVNITGLPISETEVGLAELEDMNGDGLSDIIVVSGAEVKLAINRNAATFDMPISITSAQGGSIPSRDTTTTVLYADMNGNGSSDVVWVDQNGQVTYLELFPVRPNLLARVENGLGSVISITYASAVEHLARDAAAGRQWLYKIPMSMLVVDSVIIRDQLTGLEEDTTWRFHDAYYDGVDKQFRGFAAVETFSEPDTTQEGGRTSMAFDLGVMDRYRAGLQLQQEVETGGRPIRLTENTYEDCPLTGVPNNLVPPVRFVCLTQVKTTIKEGQPQGDWTVVEESREYDGYGNIVKESKLGITSVGGAGCAPCTRDASVFGQACGAMCTGDEQYTETTYAEPDQAGGGWLLRLPTVARVYGRPGGEATETRTYYDGPDFVGLPLGQATHGHPTRTSSRVSASGMDFIDMVRTRFDDHGNPVEVIDANGNATDHALRRQWTYDSYGLHIIRTNHLMLDDTGAPYILRKEYQYDPLFDKPVLASEWFVVKDGLELTPRNNQQWTFNVQGRLSGMVLPGGDNLASPTQSITYDYGNPLSRVTIRQRSRVGQPQDLEEHHCYDGNGRVYQVRKKIDAGTYAVSGFTTRNRQGEEVREYQPYTSTEAACDMAPPAGTLFEESHMDALGRVTRTVHADAADRGGVASESRTVFLPLAVEQWDEEDTAGTGGTPTLIVRDGLNRVVRVDRRAAAGAAPVVHHVTYDEWGNLRGYVDPLGQEKVQEHDLMGRVTRMTDSSRGTVTWTHDPHGSPISMTDARGITLRWSHDGANRVLAQWQEGQETTTRVAYRYDLPPEGCAPQDCSNTANQATRVTYPLNGGTAEDVFGYTARGDITMARRNLGGGATFQFNHTYDNAGRMVGSSYPRGMQVAYTHDGAGRITSAGSHVPSITYDERGLTGRMTLGNGLRHQQEYDARLQVERITVGPATGTGIMDLAIQRNRRGHVTRVTDALAPANGPSHTAAYMYDGLNRLTRAELDPGNAMLQEVLNITYDGGDRILTASSSVAGSRQDLGSYTYDAVHAYRATRIGSRDITYDAAGHVLTRGNLSMTWDHQGRLAQATRGTATVGTYAYGPQGQRIFKQEGSHQAWYPATDYEVRDGVATLWVRLADTRVAKVERAGWAPALYSDVAPVNVSGTAATPQPDGTISAADAWVAQAASAGILSLPQATAPSDVRALLAASARELLVGTGDVVTYLHPDHLGTTLVTTDGAGAVVEHVYRYPFGAARRTGAGMQEDRGFTGKEEDEATGFVFFGSRYLDPETGRWLSADPGFEKLDQDDVGKLAEASSPYAYVGNNPVSFRDREGKFLDFGPVGAVVGMVVGAAMEIWAQKNRGENISWGGVAAAAAIGALVGGVGGLAGVGLMAIGRGVEMVAYHAADAHFQKKVAAGTMTAQVAHEKATMWSKVAGALTGLVTGSVQALSAAGSLATKALGLLKTAATTVGSIVWAKVGPKVTAWAKGVASRAWEGAKKLGTRAANALSRGWATVKAGASRAANAIGRGLAALGRGAMKAIGAMGRGLAAAAPVMAAAVPGAGMAMLAGAAMSRGRGR